MSTEWKTIPAADLRDWHDAILDEELGCDLCAHDHGFRCDETGVDRGKWPGDPCTILTLVAHFGDPHEAVQESVVGIRCAAWEMSPVHPDWPDDAPKDRPIGWRPPECDGQTDLFGGAA